MYVRLAAPAHLRENPIRGSGRVRSPHPPWGGMPAVLDRSNQTLELWHGGRIPPPDDPGWRGGGDNDGRRGQPSPAPVARLLAWLIGASMSMFFLALSTAYVIRQSHGAGWSAPALPAILWLNTALLLASDGWLRIARRRAEISGAHFSRAPLAFAALLAIGFVAGQAAAWVQVYDAGIRLAGNVAASFFYVLTVAHALHVAGGLAALAWVGCRLRHKLRESHPLAGQPPGKEDAVVGAIEAAEIYWRFLTVIWIYIFAILLVWR
jgi:cytochrome c oxidase subunit 3